VVELRLATRQDQPKSRINRRNIRLKLNGPIQKSDLGKVSTKQKKQMQTKQGGDIIAKTKNTGRKGNKNKRRNENGGASRIVREEKGKRV